jgi:hypothetical protein
MVEWCKILLVMGSEDRLEFCCARQVHLVRLTSDAELGRQVDYMTQNTKLSGKPSIRDAVVKVYRDHA